MSSVSNWLGKSGVLEGGHDIPKGKAASEGKNREANTDIEAERFAICSSGVAPTRPSSR